MIRVIRNFRTLLVTGWLVISVCYAEAQTNEFTYQGSLNTGGTPATGNFDFEFLLFSALSGGTQQGSTITSSNVPVANGIFAVKLNFGTQFPGATRFLEIRVRPSGGGAFTPLAPRQQITSEPYAINSAQLGGVSASQYFTANSAAIGAATQFNLGGNRILAAPGAANMFVGANTGASYSSGVNNSYFGSSAGQNNAIGGENSFFGAFAGQLSTGNGNSFFGSESGRATTSGSDDSFFGAGSGDSNTTGTFNSFFGRSAGGGNTTGNNNTFVGRHAGLLNQAGSDNAFFGFEAGRANNTNNNSFFGYQAGRETNGGNNSFVGYQAGMMTTAGIDNSFVGAVAGTANTLGAQNSFFGARSGDSNTSGSSNVFAGYAAGHANANGNNNTFVGANAGAANVIGANNTVLGANANFTGGSRNFATAVGAGAVVATDNTVVLGRDEDTVKVPGSAAVTGQLTVSDFINGGIVKATQFWQSFFQGSSPTFLCYFINAAGYAVFTGCGSSIRYKKDVADYGKGMEIVNRLRPVSFAWKRDNLHDLGFIAEEVAEIDDLLITRDRDGRVDGVKYDRMAAIFVNSLKEQQSQIEAQAETIKRQQQELNALTKVVCATNATAEVCKP